MKLELKLETAEDVRDIAIKVNYKNKKSEAINLTPSDEHKTAVKGATAKIEAPKEFTNFKV